MTAATIASAPKTTAPTAIATLARMLMLLLAGSCFFPQHVADPADRLYQPRLAQLPSQVADVDPEAVRFRAEVVPPHRFEYLGPGQYPVRVAQEQFEEREFGLGQRQPRPAAAGLVGRDVELD